MTPNILLSWRFPEYSAYSRKKSWYVWAGIFFLGLLCYAIFTANFLFGLIIIMAAIILFVNQNQKPQNLNFSLSEKGLIIEDKIYPYAEIKKFWLLYEPPEVKNIYFEFKSSFKPILMIPLENQNPLKVREVLKKYLAEDLEKENESTSEALARVLKL
ncbi:hypothetical protein COU23_03025 [Candidatus Kuenenbacteria bacterium CG10_big_fil_rev_8_21_14_0_10_36_11]|uniref:DUF5673 domain-containing protein n=1 Tax=Candidatus Kuenenbacteria bacterium CG10_big_fil_rev_8_21_14_0_10_36_11 TaxID=1974618 RepID=A0A2M6W9X2_9BACT|nr:MAG: hypothetical protein COU23_03025 [Candidatus Kuenenbacteria bacterium CG10_big_fil_rev_8_21_14_0_10_36_11]